jgi:hypothetical protein
MEVCVAFIDVPLSAVSIRTVFSTPSVVLPHSLRIHSIYHHLRRKFLLKVLPRTPLLWSPGVHATTWCKCAGILMTAFPSSSIENTYLHHKHPGSITSWLSSPVNPASRLDITCSNSTVFCAELSISTDVSNARSDNSGLGPTILHARHYKWTVVRCLLNALPRYKGAGKCAVSPKKDSTTLRVILT